MKKFEISAFSIEEAKQQAAEMGITVVKNVTPSFKKTSTVNFDEFALEMLKKNHIDTATGVGCMVVLSSGSSDTRLRPYEFVNNVTEGSLTKKRVFQVRTVSDDRLIAEAETKGEAARLAKNAMKDVKEDMVCKQIYKVVGDHALAFSLKYVPSVNTTVGKYIVFGNRD